MKTLALLAVMLLVALQARAELLMVNADEVVDQQQSGAEDQDVAMYVKEGESSILEALGESYPRAELYQLRERMGRGLWSSLGE